MKKDKDESHKTIQPYKSLSTPLSFGEGQGVRL